MKFRRLVKFALVTCLLVTTSCGKYGPPVAPEIVAPAAVQELFVSGTTAGIALSWTSPSDDRRGRELRNLEGYRIERKTVEKPSDAVDPEIEFQVVAEIPDSHVEKLVALREEARAAGKITRKVTVDQSLTKFSFLDSSVVPGGRYVYQVIPVNNGGTEGARGKLIQVLFRGETSEIRLFEENELASDIFS